MVAYSFNKQFVGPILQGTKRQTIRGDRKRHARPGEVLQLYTAMRTKYCRPIGVAVCQLVSPITIDFDARRITYQFGPGVTTVYPGGLDGFAQGDGFTDWPAMLEFWAAHHPISVFNGRLIRWTEFSPAQRGGVDGLQSDVPGWDGNRRADGMFVGKTLSGIWIAKPPDRRPAIVHCPLCQKEFATARAAKLVAETLYPGSR